MKPSLNLVLVLSSAALLAQASVWFAHASPKLLAEPHETFHKRGMAEAKEWLAKSTVPPGTKWVYEPALGWWQRFRNVNLVGTQPPVLQPIEPPHSPSTAPVKPLDQIIDLVSLAYDGPSNGKGGESHVVVRYKQDSGVKPPPEVLRAFRNLIPSGKPGDIAASATTQGPPGAKRTTVPRPPVTTAIEYVQLLRVGQRLWPDFEDVMLVEVSPDADLAWFVRVGPDGQPGTERMPLFKSNLNMSKQVQDLLDRMKRDNIGLGAVIADAPSPATPTWLDVAETTRIGDTFHIGRNDAKAFGDEDRLQEQVQMDTWRSRQDSSMRGVQVRRIDAKLGTTYGIRSGDVLISINNQPVQTPAQLITVLRKQYQIGTRTFSTKWLSATGEEVERIYQAPPGKNDR